MKMTMKKKMVKVLDYDRLCKNFLQLEVLEVPKVVEREKVILLLEVVHSLEFQEVVVMLLLLHFLVQVQVNSLCNHLDPMKNIHLFHPRSTGNYRLLLIVQVEVQFSLLREEGSSEA